ncbi:MAG: ferrochelatase [Gammaproteobacteria bacterium]
MNDNAGRYDALLIVSFGGPEGPDDVMPFLDNVLKGLPVKPEAKQGIARRYQRFGGVSPINGETRMFIDALKAELAAHDIELPVYWGNRNWHPMLTDTLAEMQSSGISRVLAHVTSTFSSYSGCRKYREDLYEACADLDNPPAIDKLRLGYNHPGFIEAMADRVRHAVAELPEKSRAEAPLMFTAHSLPVPMAENANYVEQLAEACRLVAEEAGCDNWSLCYQSNNASYGVPWLEPDINDVIRGMSEGGTTAMVVAPIGFVCDHMEVVLDLDVEAQATAQEAGVTMVRAATVGTHPAYIGMIRELIEERLHPGTEKRALGKLGPSHDVCPPDCCLSGRPGDPKPSLCGSDGT